MFEGGVRRHHLFRDGRVVVFPRAKVQLDLSRAPIALPHTEDSKAAADSVAAVGRCREDEWEKVLKNTSFPDVAAVFKGFVEGGRRALPGTGSRSRGTIENVRVQRVTIDNSYGRQQFRMDFADDSGQTYRRFPINDLAFRSALQANIEALGDERKAEKVALR